MSKSLYELVLMYKSDVETRISVLQEDYANDGFSPNQKDDILQQIYHWEATLKIINETLGGDLELSEAQKRYYAESNGKCPECGGKLKPVGGDGDNELCLWCEDCDVSIDTDGGYIK